VEKVLFPFIGLSVFQILSSKSQSGLTSTETKLTIQIVCTISRTCHIIPVTSSWYTYAVHWRTWPPNNV